MKPPRVPILGVFTMVESNHTVSRTGISWEQEEEVQGEKGRI